MEGNLIPLTLVCCSKDPGCLGWLAWE